MNDDARDLLIGIDAGTSVIKAVAFDLRGKQIAVASAPNRYTTSADGAATQSLDQTWADCARTLRDLGAKIDGLAQRTRALAVTGQGDGTWLVGADNRPASDAWLWLDARAASTVRRLQEGASSWARFEATGTGLAACSQGAQIAHMAATMPDVLSRAEVALHCKDWLYLNLTGVRATDPSEASFTFGNFRTRRYDDTVIDALGLSAHRKLLPEIVDGTQTTHPLSAEAAAATGLLEGTPVCLGFVDIVLTALGAGIHTEGAANASCSIVGSTGMHMRAMRNEDVHLNAEGTGYVIALPLPGMSAQVQSNMAASLNVDWVLNLATDLLKQFGTSLSHADRMTCIDGWLQSGRPGALLYHPYISDAGERGPFVDPNARADFIGLTSESRYPDLFRAVVEGLGMAARDCYTSMGLPMPDELRLTGGATRSRALRAVLGAVVGAPTRISARDEAGAAGAAMMAAVALGVYPNMNACIAEWVTPLLGPVETQDSELIQLYARLFPAYRQARQALVPTWDETARLLKSRHRPDAVASALN
ncbi:FGGY-family carbohydrate kinase [Caballeronia sp. BR00000012568055]|uniref:FGGY-family carbohydrate kinase n=1 Tax=Caballeronia sp. BR00000012568055 TaxID=2918761 RepID=UPI0023F88C38|nr:FGGY-family carbohydrate kinase [Caballeronia sp. BR00000012568055]